MPHPPYSSDLAPSDYHLFRSLQNHLNGKTFDSNEAVKNELIQFFAAKNKTFYESGIMKLTERWQKVIEQNGQYIIKAGACYIGFKKSKTFFSYKSTCKLKDYYMEQE